MTDTEDTTGETRRRRARPLLTLAGGVLVAVGAVAVGVGVSGQHRAPPTPPASPAAQPTPRADPVEGASEPIPGQATDRSGEAASVGLDYAAPVRVSIPTIGVSSPLVELGLNPKGVMQTPQNPDRAGWFSPAPPPGVPGAAVVAGHVTWDRQPVVFFRLGDLRHGDKIRIARADHTTAVFEVYKTGTFPKRSFPTDAVYDQPNVPELRLITCGGGYDETTNNYRANVIVWAKMVAAPRGT